VLTLERAGDPDQIGAAASKELKNPNQEDEMAALRVVLIAMTAIMFVLTVMAVANSGLDLFTPFIGPIFALNWQGQFNADFAMYLVLSGIWMAWRSGYNLGGTALAICTPALGILFFAPYLIYLIGKSDGDARKLLLGVHA
jgi:hypothetical protein